MSSELVRPDFEPFIALVDKAARALREDMIASGHRAGFPELAYSHNVVFATLGTEGSRASDMAARTGITRQSMGEAVRDLVRLGIVEMVEDPSDRRAKLVRYSDYGAKVAQAGFDHIMALERELAEEVGAAELETTRKVLLRVRELLKPDPA